MPRRIAIDGSHATGKTTLLNTVALQLGSWPLISESARAVAPGFGINNSADWAGLYADAARHRAFLDAVLARQLAEERQASFLSDGTLYRTYAYAHAAGIELDPHHLVPARYDVICYCPLDLPFAEDGFRFARDREAVDAALRALIARHHQGAFVELRGRLSERAAEVLRLVG